jgi:CheY-like chemotaxis protein
MYTVLVIDDERDVRDGVKRVLERAGFRVRVVDNVADAMLELERAPADIVVTDVIMPKVDGVQAIGQILQRFPAVRIVAISGGGNFNVDGRQSVGITTSAYLTAAKNAGAHGILNKPFDSRELVQAVAAVVRAPRSMARP